jgi:hypothetical protein
MWSKFTQRFKTRMILRCWMCGGWPKKKQEIEEPNRIDGCQSMFMQDVHVPPVSCSQMPSESRRSWQHLYVLENQKTTYISASRYLYQVRVRTGRTGYRVPVHTVRVQIQYLVPVDRAQAIDPSLFPCPVYRIVQYATGTERSNRTYCSTQIGSGLLPVGQKGYYVSAGFQPGFRVTFAQGNSSPCWYIFYVYSLQDPQKR